MEGYCGPDNYLGISAQRDHAEQYACDQYGEEHLFHKEYFNVFEYEFDDSQRIKSIERI